MYMYMYIHVYTCMYLLQAQYEKELQRLKGDVLEMKKQRVRLLTRMRTDASQKKIDVRSHVDCNHVTIAWGEGGGGGGANQSLYIMRRHVPMSGSISPA